MLRQARREGRHASQKKLARPTGRIPDQLIKRVTNSEQWPEIAL